MNQDDLNFHKEILQKELGLIQDVIKRMAANSFQVKAWAMALFSGIIAFTLDKLVNQQSPALGIGISYIYSSFAMNPSWNGISPLKLRALLNNSLGFFIPGSQTILDQTGIPADDTWRQTISCFTATDNYNRLFIKPYGIGGKYAFVDEVYLSPDNFPAANNLLNAVTCGEQFTLGNTCIAIPNVLFTWETSTNGSNWTPIPGATAGTYTTPALLVQ